MSAALLMTLAFTAAAPEVIWSPDGHWVAYVLAAPEPGDSAPPWLFRPDRTESASPDRSRPPRVRTERLWSTHVGTGESVLLDEVQGCLTAPAWKVDGTALAFGRLTVREGGKARYEVVVKDATEHPVVLKSWDFDSLEPAWADRIAGARLAWSADGRYLVYPQPDLPGLAIFRTDEATVVKTLAGARAPNWAPDGKQLAFFGEGGVFTLDTRFAEPRRVIEMRQTDHLPAPFWTRDGQALLTVYMGPSLVAQPGRPLGTQVIDLVRVRIAEGRYFPIQTLVPEPLANLDQVISASVALDLNNLQVFTSVVLRSAPKPGADPNQLAWLDPQRGAVKSRFNPFDLTMPIWGISFARSGGLRLGLRAGPGTSAALAALCDPDTQSLTPLLPDDGARVVWLSAVLDAIRVHLQDEPAHAEDGQLLDRVALLPSPAEMASPTFGLPRLRHLARIGLPACQRPTNAPPPTPAVAALIDQARLVFEYLSYDRGDPTASYRKAMKAHEVAMKWASTPDKRFRMLCLRAQIDLGLGDRERALETIRFLRSQRPDQVESIEETATGFQLTATPVADASWLEQLELSQPNPATGPNGPRAPGDNDLDGPPAEAAPPGVQIDRVDVIQIIPGLKPNP